MKEIIIDSRKAQKKTFHCQIKSVDSQRRIIKGWANTRFLDRVGDVVDPNAFKDTLQMYLKNPVVLYQHDQDHPIGKTLSASIQPDGLWVEIEILPAGKSAKIDEVWNLIEFGALSAFSIGYKTLEVDFQDDFFLLSNLELLEISVVSIPANRESLFSVAKSYKDGTDLIEKAPPKIGWEKTKSESGQILRLFEKEYKNFTVEQKLYVENFSASLQTLIRSDEEAHLLEVLHQKTEELASLT